MKRREIDNEAVGIPPVTIRRGKPEFSQTKLSPHKARRAQASSLRVIIMDSKKNFNTLFSLESLGIDVSVWEAAIRDGKDWEDSFRKAVQEAYSRQAYAFFEEYNKCHPDERLFAHGTYKRRVVFFLCGQPVKIRLRASRFKHAYGARRGKTFSFFGSMLVSGTSSSRQFIECVVRDEEAEEKGEVGGLVSEKTAARYVRSWNNALKAWQDLSKGLPSRLFDDNDPAAIVSHLLCLLGGHLPMERLCR